MVDDGVSSKRAAGEPDPVLSSADGAPVFPDDHIGGSLPEMVIDFGESPLEGPERSTSSIEPDLALPEDLWGEPREGTGAVDALHLELEAETPVTEDWWRPTGDVDDVLGERGGPEGFDVDASLPIPSVARPAQPHRTPAPAPVAPGRWSAVRRSVEALHLNRRAAAAGLAGVAAAGLLVAVDNRSSEEPGRQRQVATAGTRPVPSVPASSLPSSTTTTVAGALPAPEPASGPGEAPATVVPPPGTGVAVATTRAPSPAPSVTTSAPLSNATVGTSPPQNAPSPAPPATRAPVITPEPDYEEPDTPPTTRRPRLTIPDTTAVPNTSSSTTMVPPADG